MVGPVLVTGILAVMRGITRVIRPALPLTGILGGRGRRRLVAFRRAATLVIRVPMCFAGRMVGRSLLPV